MACVDFGVNLVAQLEAEGVDLERDGGCAGWVGLGWVGLRK